MNEFNAQLAILANGRGTIGARLGRMHRYMLSHGEDMLAAGLLAGNKRVALANAMYRAQTPEGESAARCIVCAERMSFDYAQSNPAFPCLITLIPSILFDTDDDVTGTDKSTAHRLGYVPGNVALACQDCAQWKTACIARGDAVVLTADALSDDMRERVLLSWEGIGTARRGDTESDAIKASRERRRVAREARGYVSA